MIHCRADSPPTHALRAWNTQRKNGFGGRPRSTHVIQTRDRSALALSPRRFLVEKKSALETNHPRRGGRTYCKSVNSFESDQPRDNLGIMSQPSTTLDIMSQSSTILGTMSQPSTTLGIMSRPSTTNVQGARREVRAEDNVVLRVP